MELQLLEQGTRSWPALLPLDKLFKLAYLMNRYAAESFYLRLIPVVKNHRFPLEISVSFYDV
jgi:hypothetical protein